MMTKTRGKKSTSGVKFVHWHSIGKKWRAQPYVNGEQFYLGLYKSIEDAAYACKKFIESNASKFNQAEFDEMVDKGTKAWADVPSATEFVENLRGNDV